MDLLDTSPDRIRAAAGPPAAARARGASDGANDVTLPYSSATSGERALGEIQKLLRGFGCNKFGSMIDDAEGTVLVQFEYRGRQAQIKASIKGYAAAWLRENPLGPRTPAAEHQRRAMDIGSVAVYSILRDCLKGQITAIETGMLSFEGAFLGNLLLPNGQTILDHVEQQKLLPAPESQP